MGQDANIIINKLAFALKHKAEYIKALYVSWGLYKNVQ